MSKAKINLANLDFSCTYSFEEFEFINEQLKTRILEVNGQPVNLFDLDENGKLVLMSQVTHCMEVTVGKIARQLDNWNVQTRQNRDVKTAQGEFNFSNEGQRMIKAPDVSFTPKVVSRQLTELQRWAFQECKDLQIDCPECDETFSDHYTYSEHYEDEYVRKWRKTE
ncbi:8250_t:CDS:2 [Ambispora gerdemannii]|uniref:8250_t:CDS:1 n=1 Tax=Ambispora gerdemannii TaxID=144530 RepID=A0A9N9E7P7_9GLOM|nr:8250_t:CDS:2 [Ambispora gerdemannii]